ncbi:allergen Tha p 1-like isoform X1 [Cydia splendana]|uniref:allergen Tha p 1-like isoform X1 n=1 Tax=Cydia splendana TaxID=1100963 RepID=UPI002120C3BA
MRVLLLCLGCLLATVAAVEYVEIDTGILLDDESKWKMLFNCLMGRGPCDGYEDIKDTLPKLVQSQCGGCTPEQKEKFEKTLKQFLERYPADYTELSNKLLPKPA